METFSFLILSYRLLSQSAQWKFLVLSRDIFREMFYSRILLEKKKEKLKRGNSTAKQRLGKLLKLDKLGGRYVR